jgi:hypothetical protein
MSKKREESSSPTRRVFKRKTHTLFGLNTNLIEYIVSYLKLSDIMILDRTSKKAHTKLAKYPINLIYKKSYTFSSIKEYFSSNCWNVSGINIKDTFEKEMKLPDKFPTSLKELHIEQSRKKIGSVPLYFDFILQCSNLTNLTLNIRSHYVSLSPLTHLKSLTLYGNNVPFDYFDMTTLNFLQHLPNLTHFRLTEGNKLKDINGLKYCTKLKDLILPQLNKLNVATNFESSLLLLEFLNIHAPPQCVKHTFNIEHFPLLRNLGLSCNVNSRPYYIIRSNTLVGVSIDGGDNEGSENLAGLPTFITPKLTELTVLEIILDNMSNKLSSCTSLQKLQIDWCIGFDTLEGIPGIHSLHTLKIIGRNNLTNCVGLEHHTSLEKFKLEIEDIKTFTSIEGLPLTIKKLTLKSTTHLRKLELKKFTLLQKLKLYHCEKLKEVFLPSSLVVLIVVECSRISPHFKGIFLYLQRIQWQASGDINPILLKMCSSLTQLKVDSHGIDDLWETIAELVHLEEVTIKGSTGGIPSLPQLVALHKLKLKYALISNTPLNIPYLKELKISYITVKI